MTHVPDSLEVSIVTTMQVLIDGQGHVYVAEMMNTPFSGDKARARAENFMRGEMARGDFPEHEGWVWDRWSNEAANIRFGDDLTNQLLGIEA